MSKKSKGRARQRKGAKWKTDNCWLEWNHVEVLATHHQWESCGYTNLCSQGVDANNRFFKFRNYTDFHIK